MRGSKGSDVKLINEKYELREKTKRLAADIETLTARILNATFQARDLADATQNQDYREIQSDLEDASESIGFAKEIVDTFTKQPE